MLEFPLLLRKLRGDRLAGKLSVPSVQAWWHLDTVRDKGKHQHVPRKGYKKNSNPKYLSGTQFHTGQAGIQPQASACWGNEGSLMSIPGLFLSLCAILGTSFLSLDQSFIALS